MSCPECENSGKTPRLAYVRGVRRTLSEVRLEPRDEDRREAMTRRRASSSTCASRARAGVVASISVPTDSAAVIGSDRRSATAWAARRCRRGRRWR